MKTLLLRSLLALAALLSLHGSAEAQVALGQYGRLRLQASHPVPPSGFINLWCKTSDATCYQTDSAGTDTALSGGGGGGSVTADAPLAGNGTSGSHLTCATCSTIAASGAAGDLLYATGSGVALSRLTIGSANKVLQSSGSAPQWASTLAGLTLSAPTLNGSPSFDSSFTLALSWSMTDCAVSNSSIAALASSSTTTGSLVKFVKPVTVSGIRFHWAGGAGALTVKCTLYDSTNSSVGSGTVAINAAGAYSCTFTPVAISGTNVYKTYTLAIWENSGAKYSYLNAGDCLPMTGNDNTIAFHSPWTLYYSTAVYHAGDTRPDTDISNVNQYFPMDPIFSAP